MGRYKRQLYFKKLYDSINLGKKVNGISPIEAQRQLTNIIQARNPNLPKVELISIEELNRLRHILQDRKEGLLVYQSFEKIKQVFEKKIRTKARKRVSTPTFTQLTPAPRDIPRSFELLHNVNVAFMRWAGTKKHQADSKYKAKVKRIHGAQFLRSTFDKIMKHVLKKEGVTVTVSIDDFFLNKVLAIKTG